MAKGNSPSRDQLGPEHAHTASTLMHRARSLRSRFSSNDFTLLMKDLTSLLLQHLGTNPAAFIEHIAAAKAFGSQHERPDDGRSKIGFGQYPMELIIALQPRQDDITDQLPNGHYFGLALTLLAHTWEGSKFLSEQMNASRRTVQFVAVRTRRRALKLVDPTVILHTVADLLEFHLPAIGTTELELRGATLVVQGIPPIPLVGQSLTVMELLSSRRVITHRELNDRNIPDPPVAVYRLQNTLKKHGLTLLLDKAVYHTYRLQGAVRVTPSDSENTAAP